MAKKKITIKKPPVLFNETQKIISTIENIVDGDFLTYWHSNNSSMTGNDLVVFYRLLKEKKKKKKLYLFIKSKGGSGKAALRIVHLLRNYYDQLIVLIPLQCASAATMLALGADLIQMGPISYLTAIDTSITHDLSPIDKDNDRVSVSQNELDRVMRLWNQTKIKNEINPYNKLYDHIHPLVFGAVDRASSLSIKITTDILSFHLKNKKEASRISNHLNSNYPSHSYPITFKEAKSIGLKVDELDMDLNTLLLELNEHYSEMAQRALSDYDELNYHDNEITKIIESAGEQTFYQKDKDWYYRTDERRWVPMNDESSWRSVVSNKNKIIAKPFFIR